MPAPARESRPPRIGLSSWTYPWAFGVPGHAPSTPMAPADLLDRAAALGVGVVQLADNSGVEALPDDEVEALAHDAAALGIALELGVRGIRPERLARAAALAERLGSPFVRTVVDEGDDRPSVAETVERLRASEAVFRDAGLLLAIENHDRFRTGEVVRIIDALGDWAAVCLDTVNSLGTLETPDAVIAALAPYAVNLHVKDVAIERAPDGLGFVVRGRPAGEGVLDLPDLLAAVAATGRVSTAVVELWTPPGDDLEATIAREARWAARSVAALRAAGAL